MAVDITGEIKAWVLRSLPTDPNDQSLQDRLSKMDVHQLLVTYINWQSRLVRPIPRTVLTSSAYHSNPSVAARQSDLDALLGKIERGENLLPHLSRRIEIIHDPATKIKKRQDLDLMLIEWEVHHLHISHEIEADGFVKRDDPLLFVMFRDQTAYVLDLMTHHDFNRDHILEIMSEEWPDAGLVHVVQGVVGLPVNYSEEERNKLRKAGINTMVEINGKVIMPVGGFSGAGTSFHATRQADSLLIAVEKFEHKLAEEPHIFHEIASSNGKVWPQTPSFQFGHLPNGGVGVIEKTTRLAFRLQ